MYRDKWEVYLMTHFNALDVAQQPIGASHGSDFA